MSETGTLLAALERHYIKPSEPLPGGIFLPEVTLGAAGGSRCDALYVGFTSTSGRLLVGHELKVSRSDWLRELDAPGKADPWADQCHAWWVVAPAGIVQSGELPDGWGLMEPPSARGHRFTVRRPAQVHKDRDPNWTAVRSILARADTLRANAISRATREAGAKAQAAVDARAEQLHQVRMRQQPDLELLRARLASIEDALGARIVSDDAARTERLGSYVDGRHRRALTLADLRVIGEAVRAGRDLRMVLEELAQPWVTPVANARQLLEGLDTAIRAVQDAARRQAEDVPESASAVSA